MDSAFDEASDRLKEIAKAAAEEASALEDRFDAGDSIEIRACLDRLCGQLTDIHAILAGDAEQKSEGLLKRFGRLSRLVKADLRQFDDEERRSLHERILAAEREALAELKVGNRWTERLLEELRTKLATAKRVDLTDRALAKICQDIDKLREYVCRSAPPPGQRKLNLILKGVHGTIKIVADVGDPTIVMGICGVYSVYSGGKMVQSAVQGLRRVDAATGPVTEALQEQDMPGSSRASDNEEAKGDGLQDKKSSDEIIAIINNNKKRDRNKFEL